MKEFVNKYIYMNKCTSKRTCQNDVCKKRVEKTCRKYVSKKRVEKTCRKEVPKRSVEKTCRKDLCKEKTRKSVRQKYMRVIRIYTYHINRIFHIYDMYIYINIYIVAYISYKVYNASQIVALYYYFLLLYIFYGL